jgi:pilus assembly protein Flp/PilA
MKKLINFFKDDEGATMPEYALMIALIAVVCILAVTAIGTAAKGKFQLVADEITKAGTS